MQAALRQQHLGFGPHHHLHLLHFDHKAQITLAHNAERWRERTHDYNRASQEIIDLFRNEAPVDLYMSVNGVRGRRLVQRVTFLTALFLDIDWHKVDGLDNLEMVLRAIESRLERFSLPTPYILSSGRGLYLKWPLRPFYVGKKDNNRNKHLATWRHCMDLLVEAFADLGADPACTDPTRLLRVAGSVNSRNGATVTLIGRAERVKLKDVYSPLLALKTPQRSAQAVTRRKSGKVTRLRTWYSLASARMGDMCEIAKARGRIKDGENRWQWLFCYAVEVAHFARSEESLLNQIQGFADQYLDRSDGKYRNVKRRFRRLIEQFNMSRDPVTGGFMRDEDKRYRHRTDTLIKKLGITAYEQRQCAAIVGKAEKERRRTEKRRKAGERPLAEYLAGHNHNQSQKAAERAVAALEMARQGMSMRAIATAMNVGVATVHRYLQAEQMDLL